MTTQSLRVAVAGPSGVLGQTVITNLLAANFTVTALTRDPQKISNSFPAAVKLVKANYDSIESLVPLLQDHDAVVDLIHRTQWEVSIRLFDAAIAAKVAHFIPSSFALDAPDPEIRKMPPIAGKMQMEEYIAAKAKDGAIAYTMIQTSMFLDWGLAAGALIPLAGGKAPVFDGGDVKMSMTLLDDVGKAVANVLVKRDSNKVRNRMVFIHSTVITQNEIIAYAREVNPEKSWDVMSLDTKEMMRKSWEAYNNGDRSAETMRGFIIGGSFGTGLGLFDHVDNEMLGIQKMSDIERKALVAKHVS